MQEKAKYLLQFEEFLYLNYLEGNKSFQALEQEEAKILESISPTQALSIMNLLAQRTKEFEFSFPTDIMIIHELKQNLSLKRLFYQLGKKLNFSEVCLKQDLLCENFIAYFFDHEMSLPPIYHPKENYFIRLDIIEKFINLMNQHPKEIDNYKQIEEALLFIYSELNEDQEYLKSSHTFSNLANRYPLAISFANIPFLDEFYLEAIEMSVLAETEKLLQITNDDYSSQEMDFLIGSLYLQACLDDANNKEEAKNYYFSLLKSSSIIKEYKDNSLSLERIGKMLCKEKEFNALLK